MRLRAAVKAVPKLGHFVGFPGKLVSIQTPSSATPFGSKSDFFRWDHRCRHRGNDRKTLHQLVRRRQSSAKGWNRAMVQEWRRRPIRSKLRALGKKGRGRVSGQAGRFNDPIDRWLPELAKRRV